MHTITLTIIYALQYNVTYKEYNNFWALLTITDVLKEILPTHQSLYIRLLRTASISSGQINVNKPSSIKEFFNISTSIGNARLDKALYSGHILELVLCYLNASLMAVNM